nr:MAG: hypothetical protein 2 [Cripavirus sp.]
MDLPWDLLIQPMYADKIRRFLGFRADIEVRVQINSMPFQAGRLLLSWIPGYKYLGTNRQSFYGASSVSVGTNNLVLPAITGSPRLDIDISSCTEATMCLPYICPYTYTNLVNGLGSAGYFQLVVYSPLVSAAGTDAEISVFMNFKNIEFQYPTGLPLSATAQIGTEALDVASPGVITNASAAFSEALGNIQDIPSVSQFAKPALWISNSINEVAKRFGWSKPSSVETTSLMKIAPARFMGNADGADNSHVLALSAYNEIQQEPSLFRTNVDEMALSHVFRTPCYFSNFAWSTGDLHDKILFTAPISPTYFMKQNGATTTWAPTLLAYTSNCFRYWRGGINFFFKFVKTKFHSGRIRIIYVPGDDTNGTVLTTVDVNACYSAVVDLRSDTDVEFNVPYVAIQQWMNIDRALPETDFSLSSSTGRIYVVVLNDLRAVSTVSSSVDVIVEVAGASDFEVSVPCTPNVYPASFLTPPVLAMAKRSLVERLTATAQIGEAESAIAPQEVLQQTGLVPEPLVSKVHLSTDFIASSLTIGEKVSSIRQIMKRFNVCWFDTGTVGTGTQYTIQPEVISSAIVNHTTPRYVDFYSYFGGIYAFYRGGFRMKFAPWNNGITGSNTYMRARLAPHNVITGNGYPVQSGTALTGNATIGAEIYIPVNVEGVGEFQAPYYTRYPILPVYASDTTYSSNNDLHANNGFYLRMTNPSGNVQFYVYRAVADDFSFGQLLGAPWISTYFDQTDT